MKIVARFYPMNYYWSNLHSLHWPDDWIIFKWLPAKMPAVSEHGGMQIIQIVSGGRNCTSRQINKSSDLSVHSQLLYEFPHQGAQSYFFLKRMAFITKRCVFSTVRTLKSTPQSKNVPMLITQDFFLSFFPTFFIACTHSTVFKRWI